MPTMNTESINGTTSTMPKRTRAKTAQGKIDWPRRQDGKKIGYLRVAIGRDPETGKRMTVRVSGTTEEEIFAFAIQVRKDAAKKRKSTRQRREQRVLTVGA